MATDDESKSLVTLYIFPIEEYTKKNKDKYILEKMLS